ncbi:MAG: glycyl-radical enzyme activating protein [Clostridiales bacterium]|nr:glycyl-radical enzyme activating protein [Clostridiales bacterium]
MNGSLFDIKECAIHDGPGLRQTVFLKGCPLRCSWCHNPEGLSARPELMVSPNGCTGCGRCREVCPLGGTMVGFGKPPGCTACGLCVTACPQRIRRVAGETVSAETLAARLMENADYYAGTGGGVTFSGGEPLMQADFVLETLRLLGPAVHTALETSGYGDENAFAAFTDAFNLILFDLKSMDDDIHRRYTGVSNRLILKNARRLCRGNTPFIFRIPVIPGVNDTEAHYRAVAELAQGAPSLLRVELLPYHITAGAKYALLQKAYQPGFETDRPIHIDLDIFTRHGIRSCVL